MEIDSQTASGWMLDAVGWANRRIARTVGEEVVFLLFEFGHAILIDARGKLLDVEGDEWEYDSAEAFWPIARLVLRFEGRLREVLNDDLREILNDDEHES